MDETTEAKTHQSCNLPSALINESDIVPAGKQSGERKERGGNLMAGWTRGCTEARESEGKKKKGLSEMMCCLWREIITF